jgi:hypothetical protein
MSNKKQMLAAGLSLAGGAIAAWLEHSSRKTEEQRAQPGATPQSTTGFQAPVSPQTPQFAPDTRNYAHEDVDREMAKTEEMMRQPPIPWTGPVPYIDPARPFSIERGQYSPHKILDEESRKKDSQTRRW